MPSPKMIEALKKRSIERAKIYAAECKANEKLWRRYAKKFRGIYCPIQKWMWAAMEKSLETGIDNKRLVRARSNPVLL
jgi:hypothetical protein